MRLIGRIQSLSEQSLLTLTEGLVAVVVSKVTITLEITKLRIPVRKTSSTYGGGDKVLWTRNDARLQLLIILARSGTSKQDNYTQTMKIY